MQLLTKTQLVHCTNILVNCNFDPIDSCCRYPPCLQTLIKIYQNISLHPLQTLPKLNSNKLNLNVTLMQLLNISQQT